jgi:hypothetical protein
LREGLRGKSDERFRERKGEAMQKTTVPGAVGIWPDPDWEENCIRIEDSSDLELNLPATEALVPARGGSSFLAVFTDRDGDLWLARKTEKDPSGLLWYEFQSVTSFLKRSEARTSSAGAGAAA